MSTNDRYGWSDASAPLSCDYLAPKILQILSQLAGIRRVCDLGSGNGALVGALAGAGYDAVGVERDQQGVELSRARYPSCRFYQVGVEGDPGQILSVEAMPFDVVVSTEVVEHLYSPHLLPSFARQLLGPGGHLVVSTPYHGYLKNLALSLANKWDYHHTPLWHGGHIKFWSRKTLTRLLEENGFHVTAFYGTGRLRWLWKSMILVARAT